jgi:hypothetical protein
VVTPPGETPTAPGFAGSAGRGGGSVVDVVGGGVDVDGFGSVDEQPAIARVSSAPHSATRSGHLRMPPNLCNTPARQGLPPPTG